MYDTGKPPSNSILEFCNTNIHGWCRNMAAEGSTCKNTSESMGKYLAIGHRLPDRGWAAALCFVGRTCRHKLFLCWSSLVCYPPRSLGGSF